MRSSLFVAIGALLFSLTAAHGLGTPSSELTSSSLHKRGCLASQCRNTVAANAHRVCKNGRCTSACNKSYRSSGGKCVLKTCTASECNQAIPANSHRICNLNTQTCAFACNSGFRWNGSACVVGVSSCKASNCQNSIPPNSRRICKDGECNFGCNLGFHREGDLCKVDATTCTASSQCTRHLPVNGLKICRKGLCGFTCRNGFKISGNGKSCVSNAGTCGTTTCDAVRNGAVDCVSGSCVYTCDTGLGYRRYVVDGSTKCVNLSKDPQNCGSIGNVCASDYVGLGKAACTQGTCTLKCPSPSRPHLEPNAPLFCS